jgi:hypothetical protein
VAVEKQGLDCFAGAVMCKNLQNCANLPKSLLYQQASLSRYAQPLRQGSKNHYASNDDLGDGGNL